MHARTCALHFLLHPFDFLCAYYYFPLTNFVRSQNSHHFNAVTSYFSPCLLYWVLWFLFYLQVNADVVIVTSYEVSETIYKIKIKIELI